MKNCPATGKVCFNKKDAETTRNMRSEGRSRIGWKSAKQPWKTGRSKRHTFKGMRIYQCPHCNYWHITHRVDEKKKLGFPRRGDDGARERRSFVRSGIQGGGWSESDSEV